MKDELNGEIIEEFISLRAKMNSLKTTTTKKGNEDGKRSEEERSQKRH